MANIGDREILTFTSGKWRSAPHRRFSIDLTQHLQAEKVTELQVLGAANAQSEAFGRYNFYVVLTQNGILQAAPVERKGDVLSGAFQIASSPKDQVLLRLRNKSAFSEVALCDQPSQPDFNFNGQDCGFELRLPSGFDPHTSNMVLKWSAAETTLNLSDILASPNHASGKGVSE